MGNSAPVSPSDLSRERYRLSERGTSERVEGHMPEPSEQRYEPVCLFPSGSNLR
jgi:hypothetical protein